ncbi:hypothetical protein DBA20_12885 [Pandoraea capi]|nr:hypothetical protein [Pandoraea sp. LA3]MDN4583878.1 hypothetical protein [Pandoraea capi]
MHPVLDVLENERGIRIYPDLISESPTDRAIYISALLGDGNRLHQELLAMGFSERARRDYPSFSVRTVSKGRLSITVHVKPLPCTSPS